MFRCPYKKKHKCGKLFTTQHEASCHGILRHGVAPLHRTEDGLYLCPFAKDFGKSGCSAIFDQAKTTQKHVNDAHKGEGLPCPLSDECVLKASQIQTSLRNHIEAVHMMRRFPCVWEGCTAEFSQDVARKDHVRGVHEKQRFPCPVEGCGETFSYAQSIPPHVSNIHQAVLFECPLAEEFQCSKLFKSKAHAHTHKKAHLGHQWLCRLEFEHDCEGEFGTIQARYNHERRHTHDFVCPLEGCVQRFETSEQAWEHAEDPEHTIHKPYICTLLRCRKTVIGKRLTGGHMRRHWAMHVRLGHVSPDASLKLTVGDPLPSRGRNLPLMFRIIGARGYQVAEEAEDQSQDPPQDTELIDEDSDDSEDLEDWETSSTSGLNGELFSTEHRAQVHEQNTTMWELHKGQKVTLGNLGLKCAGPALGTKYFIDEPCPHQATLDLDTARLFWVQKDQDRGGIPHTRLDCRCVACHEIMRIMRLLQQYDVEHRPDILVCTVDGCNRSTLCGSGRCTEHLGDLIDAKDREGPEVDLRLLRRTFETAAEEKWTSPPDYNRLVRQRIADIQIGKRPGSDLVILDDEFSSASCQLWEFAMVEQVSGKVLINTLIQHPDGIQHVGRVGHPFEQSKQAQSYKKHSSVYSQARTSKPSSMNVRDVALKLQEVGITRDTVFLVWHNYKADLGILRMFLATGGYEDILPPDDHCVPLIQLFRSNLRTAPPGLKRFPLKLEILFPLLHPRHPLIGFNHQALVDCQQTRLVIITFEELCKLVEERAEEWQWRKVSKPSQSSILDWAHPMTNSEGDGSRKRKRLPTSPSKNGSATSTPAT